MWSEGLCNRGSGVEGLPNVSDPREWNNHEKEMDKIPSVRMVVLDVHETMSLVDT
jgi:hypothetical protein